MPEKIAIQSIPAALRELYQKGVAALEKNNLDYAVTLFQTVLRQEPGFYPCREALRAAQFKRSGAKSSIFRRFVGAASSLTRGQLALRNNPAEALLIAEEILADDPSNRDAHQLVADAALALDLPKTAILSLEVAFKANQNDRKLAEKLADALVATGQNQRAEKILRDLLSHSPNDPSLNEKLKNTLASRTLAEGGYNQLADGSGSYRDILRDREQAVVLEQEQRAIKDATSAAPLLEDLQRRLASEPDNQRLLRQLADIHLQSKNFDEAIATFQNLQTVSGIDDPAISRAIVDAHLAKIDHSETTLDPSAPDHAARIAELAQTRLQLQLTDAKRRADAYPNDLQIRLELGELYFRAGKISEAIGELQKAQNNPNRRITAMNLLAQCFAKRGMNDLAARKLQDALKEKLVFDDEKKDLHYQLGVVLEKMGKRDEAIEQFKVIYEQDISFRDVMARIDAYYASPQS